MAEHTPSQEAVVQAVATGKEAVGPALTKDQERANKIRESLTKRSNDETIAGFLKREPKIEGIRSLVDKSIGTEIDPITGEKKRTGEAQARFDDATKSVDRINSYLQGVDTLSREDRKVALSQVEDVFRMLPGGGALLDDLSDRDKNLMLEDALRDPNFRNQLLDKIEQIQDKGIAKEHEVEETEAAVKEAELAKAHKEKVLKRIDAELKDVKSQLDKFGPESATTGIPEKTKALKDIEDNLPTLETDAKSASSSLRLINAKMSQINQQMTMLVKGKAAVADLDSVLQPLYDELTTLNSDRAEEEGKIASLEEAKAKKTQLQEEKQSLRASRRELEEKRDEAEVELDPLKQKHEHAQRALAVARKARAGLESELVTSLEDVFADTAVQYYIDKVTKAEEAQQGVLEKEVSEAKDALEKQMLEIFSRGRWDRMSTKRSIIRPKRQTIEINRDVVNQDFAFLVQNGPEAAIRGILASNGMNASDIDAKMKDPEFGPKMQNMMIEQLITRKLKVGKITENEAFIIGTSPWGAEAIDTAIAKNAAVNASIDKLRGAGALTGDGALSWIKNHPDKSLAAWLLSLVMGGAAAAIALPVAAVGLGGAGLAIGGGAAIKGLQR